MQFPDGFHVSRCCYINSRICFALMWGKQQILYSRVRGYKDWNNSRRRYLEDIWKLEQEVIEGWNVEHDEKLQHDLCTSTCFVWKFKWNGMRVTALVLPVKYTLGLLASSDKGKRQRGNRGKDQETRNSKDFLWVYAGQNHIHLNAFVKWKKKFVTLQKVWKSWLSK